MFGSDKKFEVENALIAFAEDYVCVPASTIYDEHALAPLLDRAIQCHIYMIGFVPKVSFTGASQSDRKLFCHMEVSGAEVRVPFDLPDGVNLISLKDGWAVSDQHGNTFFPSQWNMQLQLNLHTDRVYFDVQYIGQAFGRDGSRNALDRLKRHETLQKIALQGVPPEHKLQLLLIKVREGNSLAIMMNPFAEHKDEDESRANAGIEKLFSTNEAERTTLFEASLIRHFEPPFNKEFKNSFPSTNMKLLNDCYEKDFSAVVAEINFDELPFHFKSATQKPSPGVIAIHNLHEAEERNVFFGRMPGSPA